MEKKFQFIRDGKQPLCMGTSDITMARLANAFQVDAESLYLKEEWGDNTFWPNEHGRFNLSHLENGASIEIMGESRGRAMPQAGNCFSYIPATTSSSRMSASSTASRPFAKKGNNNNSYGCKVVLATMKKNKRGGAEFTEKNQMYINITEETANVAYITTKAKEKFGKGVALVAGNGLPIEDEEGTRGLKFWRIPSRKVYAIKEKDSQTPWKREKRVNLESDATTSEEESAFNFKTAKRKKLGGDIHHHISTVKDELVNISSDLTMVVETAEASRQMLQQLTQVNKFTSLPLSVVKLVKDAFKCRVCLKVPMNPPVIATRCCSTLLGCSPCINTWYSGEEGLDKTCPHCREPRGYAQTFQFKGLDEFLTGFGLILADSTSESSQS